MIRIVLLCSGGLSTSFLVQNMNKAVRKRGLDAEVRARGEGELVNCVQQVDAVLLAPQARYGEQRVRELCTKHGKPYAIIDSIVYGRMDGEAALNAALALLQANQQS